MTINLINPGFNLIGTAGTSGLEQSIIRGCSASADAANGAQNFYDVLKTILSKTEQSNPSDAGIDASAEGKTVNLDEIFQKASDIYHVPVPLLKAVAKAESNFDPGAQSHAGAQGIMQLMPGTAKSLGVTDSFDPEQNIMGGAKYLSQQLERYEGNTTLALAAYNAGPGNVAKYGGVPPFQETRNYIARVMGYAGETITAGEVITTGEMNTVGQMILAGQSMEAGQTDMPLQDYALIMELYRCRMQLNLLADTESDSAIDSYVSLV